jgi:hypothetical protein
MSGGQPPHPAGSDSIMVLRCASREDRAWGPGFGIAASGLSVRGWPAVTDSVQTEFGENLPAYKPGFVERCLTTDGVATEIKERRYGHKYFAGIEGPDGHVWMASIETDNGEGKSGEPRPPQVIFRECVPGHELHVMHSWSTVAVKRLPGPSDLQSWRTLHTVFHAADQLLQTHEDAVLRPGERYGGDGA